MKRPQSVALVAAGPVKKSAIAQSPEVLDRLGPVKALSYRVASRIANRLRAGEPAGSYEDLDECKVLLISVPDSLAGGIVEGLRASGIAWPGKTVLLCDTALDSSVLAPLASQGAVTGSILLIDELDPPRYLLEGQREAVLTARRLFAAPGRTIELRPGRKPLYLAGLAFASGFVAALASGAEKCLRKAGVSAVVAPELVERHLLRSSRMRRRKGKAARGAPLAGAIRVEDLRAALSAHMPELATYFDDNVRGALTVLRRLH